MKHPYYFHAPGHPSRWGVVDVGLKCVHSCKHCFYSFMDGSTDQFAGMRHAKFHSREGVLEQISGLAENGFLGFDVTGGEPCAWPHIVEAIRHAAELALSSRIITLGQFLGRKELLERLLDAGLSDFRFSFHSSDPELFKKMTGGDLALLVGAMDKLQSRGFQYMTNTTITADNYRTLPDLARFLAARPELYAATFLLFMPYYEWQKGETASVVRVPYPDVAPYLREAVAITEAAAIATTVRYAPLCTVAGLEKNHVGTLGVRYDPHEWMNQIDHRADPETTTLEQMRAMGRRIPMADGDPTPGMQLLGVKGNIAGVQLCAGRGDAESKSVSKVFPALCEKCSAIHVCDGIDPAYLRARADRDFVPYCGQERRKFENGCLDRERLAYFPAFFVKREPEADIKGAIRRTFFPEPISARPRVSVIVPCYNYGKFLGACLDSLMAQTWRPLQIIVVDDCSNDDSETVARSFLDKRDEGLLISYGKMPEHQGQPAPCRNSGIGSAVGELIMCLDADDQLKPSAIEEMVRQFQRHPEAAIVYPGTQWVGDGQRSNGFAAGPYDFDTLLWGCIIVCCSMFRREVFDAVGGFKTNVKGAEDHNFWIEAGGLGYFGAPLPRQLFLYRRHKDGLFETEVAPNIDEKNRQIVLNNSDLYPPGVVRAAREGRTVTRSID